jgi:recombination protein RecA
MLPEEDVEKVKKAADKDNVEELRIGGIARLMNKYLPVVESIIEVTGTTVIFINQVRDKIGAMLFAEKTDTPGGHKLKHSDSIKIQIARRSWIEIPNKDARNSATNKTVGMIMKCRVVKSKVCNPRGECEIPLFFDRGFVSFDDVPTIRKELMAAEKEKHKKKKEEADG